MHSARGLCPLGPHVLWLPLRSFPRSCLLALRAFGAFGAVRWRWRRLSSARCVCARSALSIVRCVCAHFVWRIRCTQRCSLALAHIVSGALSVLSVACWHWRTLCLAHSVHSALFAGTGAHFAWRTQCTERGSLALAPTVFAARPPRRLLGCFSPSVLCAAHGSPCAFGTPLGPTHRCYGLAAKT